MLHNDIVISLLDITRIPSSGSTVHASGLAVITGGTATPAQRLCGAPDSGTNLERYG